MYSKSCTLFCVCTQIEDFFIIFHVVYLVSRYFKIFTSKLSFYELKHIRKNHESVVRNPIGLKLNFHCQNANKTESLVYHVKDYGKFFNFVSYFYFKHEITYLKFSLSELITCPKTCPFGTFIWLKRLSLV